MALISDVSCSLMHRTYPEYIFPRVGIIFVAEKEEREAKVRKGQVILIMQRVLQKFGSKVA